MKNIFLIFALSIFGLMSAQNTYYVKSIDSLMGSFKHNNAFSGSVLIQKDGKTVYKGEFNRFGDYSDKYRVGSITKIFTAIITFQLIEEGKLTLDTTLDKYYPDIKNADEITIGHLLNHTSGIYNYLEWDVYYISKQKRFSKKEMLDLIFQGKPDFKPGKDCIYSNSNYLLLGYIIEDITAKSYKDNLNERVVDKIGLQNTYCETKEEEYPKRNISYLFNGEKWIKETETHPSFTFSAGAVVSTTEDLSKLMDNLFKGKLVSEASLAQMGKTNNKAIGYGLFMTPFYDKIGYGHSGNIDEFHSFTGYFPNERVSVSLLSNGGNIHLNDIAVGIASKYFNRVYKNKDFTVYKSETAPPTKIYSGVYKAKLLGLINIETFQISQAANNYLFLSMYEDGKDAQKVLLERKGENKFYARKNNAQFDFIVDKKGNVTGMKLTQNKQSISCKKVM
ncbi:D-alanyl-D-alanine carboxypeptidase [Paenimyroides ummariense]|uniref:D-alanyl-D-alanine carboxypeptidase n=1 Tax=Paenimyroides ummariense TaxID=913024 RepID=A0A1I5DLM5_9FLAO|nr:serine hydrolase domain-containing protein [Paenimyroides ummariense]SFO00066.1 D-alanyl-D-alanine carboxypeptidase [Paenimyroides ummariense]